MKSTQPTSAKARAYIAKASASRRPLSLADARAVLREYPDADLSAFRIMDGKREVSADAIANEEAEKSMAAIGRLMRGRR